MVNFDLSPGELAIRSAARAFASTHLAGARKAYSFTTSHAERFQSIQPIYREAVKAGLIKGQVPAPIGGTGGSLIEAAILVEELYAEEPAASLTIFGTGLGLTPLALAWRPELKEFLKPFLSGEGAPLASLVFSEPQGVANWLESGAPGLQTTAYLDGEDWVLNGEKIWATNSAGWDFKGPDLSCVVCRDSKPKRSEHSSPEDSIMMLLVTRADIARGEEGCFQVLSHPQVAGHTAVSGPHIKYTNLRIPGKNLLCAPGSGAAVVSRSFDMTAVLVGAMGVGIQRAIFDAALSFSHSPRGGTVPIGERQSVADLLIDIKMRTETSRYLSWKAAHRLQSNEGSYDDKRELALEAKIYCSDSAVKSAVDAINLVGVSAYDLNLPFTDLLNDAMVLPIFDGGNVGIRKRALQKLFMSKDYKPWATCYD